MGTKQKYGTQTRGPSIAGQLLLLLLGFLVSGIHVDNVPLGGLSCCFFVSSLLGRCRCFLSTLTAGLRCRFLLGFFDAFLQDDNRGNHLFFLNVLLLSHCNMRSLGQLVGDGSTAATNFVMMVVQ